MPPIGAIIIVDQLLVRRRVTGANAAAFRWQPFVAWAIGSGAALVVNLAAPAWSTVVVGLVVSAVAYIALSAVTRSTAPAPAERAEVAA